MLDHDAVDRPENIWAREPQDEHLTKFVAWWRDVFYPKSLPLWERPTQILKRIFGRQTTTVVFSHRNWVWDAPDEGWRVYVSKRGIFFHVRSGMSPDEAWAAFDRFKTHVEAYLSGIVYDR